MLKYFTRIAVKCFKAYTCLINKCHNILQFLDVKRIVSFLNIIELIRRNKTINVK